MEPANRKGNGLTSEIPESSDQTNSGNEQNEKSEEYKNFENFAKRLGSLTRNEIDTVLKNEEKEKRERKTPRK